MHISKKINGFRWNGSCFTVSSFLYKFKLLKTQLRVHVYVAHYVIFLLLVERQVAYLSKSSKKQILETIIFNLEAHYV